ncbi:MAG: hypothetical protein ACI8RD_008741, partial [Bacillariaceae sp.]
VLVGFWKLDPCVVAYFLMSSSYIVPIRCDPIVVRSTLKSTFCVLENSEEGEKHHYNFGLLTHRGGGGGGRGRGGGGGEGGGVG